MLSEKFFEDSLIALKGAFHKSILSLRPKISSGELFYPMLGEHHFIDESIRPGFYHDVPINDEDLVTNWRESLLLDPSMHLEAGVDFGNQMSMIIGQQLGSYYYVSKEFWTLDPDNIDDLGKKLVEYYKGYPTKTLHVYYDRSGNQNRKVKADWANWLKEAIEKVDGVFTGWEVVLMSRNQMTIGQDEEHLFTKRFMGEYSQKLPFLRIAKHQCPNFVSSLQSAKTELKKTKDGSTYVGKDKRNEKTLKGMNLVRYSTNFSDAGKYLFCRPNWQKILNSQEFTMSDPMVVGN